MPKNVGIKNKPFDRIRTNYLFPSDRLSDRVAALVRKIISNKSKVVF